MTPSETFELVLYLLGPVVVLERAARSFGLPPSAVMVLAGVGVALVPGCRAGRVHDAVVGAATHILIPNLPWPACFALGAIVSPAQRRRG